MKSLKSLSLKSFLVIALLCAIALPAHADVKIKNRMTVSGFNMETTTYMKGASQRNDMNGPYGGGSYSLYQCDQKRMLQVNSNAGSYFVTSLDESAPAATPDASTTGGKHSGGVVTITSKMTDTGERKKVLGYDARHVTVEMITEPGPGACTPKSNMKMDLWFIDLPGMAGCANNPREFARVRPNPSSTSECGDTVIHKMEGMVKPGYPAIMEMTMPGGPNGQMMTMHREAVEISTDTLDPSLFTIPANFKQVASAREMFGGPGAAGRPAMGGGASSGYGAPNGYGASTSPAAAAPPSAGNSAAGACNYPAGYRPTNAADAQAYANCMRAQYSGQIAAAQNAARQAQAGGYGAPTTPPADNGNNYANTAPGNTAPAGYSAAPGYGGAASGAQGMTPGGRKVRIGLLLRGESASGATASFQQRLNYQGFMTILLNSKPNASADELKSMALQMGCTYYLIVDEQASGSVTKQIGEATISKPGEGPWSVNLKYKFYKTADGSVMVEDALLAKGQNSPEGGVIYLADKVTDAIKEKFKNNPNP